MKNLEIKTRREGKDPKYAQNLKSVTTFLNNSDDRITFINGNSLSVEIYENGNCIFLGDKEEFFKKIKKWKHSITAQKNTLSMIS